MGGPQAAPAMCTWLLLAARGVRQHLPAEFCSRASSSKPLSWACSSGGGGRAAPFPPPKTNLPARQPPTFQAVPSSVSMCSPHMASSSCTLSTLPVPLYARESSVTWANLEICSPSVLTICRANARVVVAVVQGWPGQLAALLSWLCWLRAAHAGSCGLLRARQLLCRDLAACGKAALQSAARRQLRPCPPRPWPPRSPACPGTAGPAPGTCTWPTAWPAHSPAAP
jgi:hypothetical protein